MKQTKKYIVRLFAAVILIASMAAQTDVCSAGVLGAISGINEAVLDGMWTSPYRWYDGHIAARGLVYSEDGNLFWVEYDNERNVIENGVCDLNSAPGGTAQGMLGEATGELEGAVVMSSAAYMQQADRYKEILSRYPGTCEVINKSEFYSRTFTLADGTQVEKPILKNPEAVSVVVKTSDALFSPEDDIVLMESPINLVSIESLDTDEAADESERIRSVLLHKDERYVLFKSVNNIGYKSAFYTGAGSSDITSPGAYDYGVNSLDAFRNGAHQLWGPVAGAQISCPLSPNSVSFSRPDGSYHLGFYIPPCSCNSCVVTVPNHIFAEMSYNVFNPKRFDLGGGGGRYITKAEVYETCHGYASNSIRYNIEIDIAFLTGRAWISNSFDRQIWINDKRRVLIDERTEYVEDTLKEFAPVAWADLDLDGDGKPDTVRMGEDDQVLVWLAGSNPETDDPDIVRRADFKADMRHQGLLASISPEDLENTDIYVFRESTGQLVCAREGLGAQVKDEDGGSALEEGNRPPMNECVIGEEKSEVTYRIPIRGPEGNNGYFDNMLYGEFGDWQEKNRMAPEFHVRKADHLRIGESVKVVMINRATGYMGTGRAAIGVDSSNKATSLLSFTPDVINMRPPNIRVTAERTRIAAGGKTNQEHLIGFEGSGLTSDKAIKLTTEWLDHDGSPLPVGFPGFTGRLAKVVSENVLGSTSGGVANFTIRPGLHTQIISLPQKDIDTAHIYLHVSGEPVSRNPDFSETGAGEGLLQYRPRHYVPILVPIYDEEATLGAERLYKSLAAEMAQRGEDPESMKKPKPVYQWVYRPEMQYSLFDFNVSEIESEKSATLATDLESYDIKTFLSSLKVFYSLFSDDQGPLESFGPERELVFSIGGQEITVKEGADQTLAFDDPELLGLLAAEDYLTLQLYQNGDDENILWEYAFPMLVRTSPVSPGDENNGALTDGGNPKKFVLARNYQAAKFELPVVGPSYTDDYLVLPFYLNETSHVSLKLYDSKERFKSEVIPEKKLYEGNYRFAIDYETVVKADIEPGSDFILKLEVGSEDRAYQNPVRYEGRLIKRKEGHMLGQVMAHDVLIQDGSLNLTRRDFSVKGRGPLLGFTRSYNNQAGNRGFLPLGPAWNHNWNKQLIATATGSDPGGAIPLWAKKLKGGFFTPDEIPGENQSDGWNLVSVNGTTFRKVAGRWHAERGRHGTLAATVDSFVYTSKDGTKYRYSMPPRPWVEAAGKDPKNFRSFSISTMRQLQSVEDRNGNRATLTYEQGYLKSVTDAVNRELHFEYGLVPTGLMRVAKRLTRITGPDGIGVIYTYNENGLLAQAVRSTRKESYDYEKKYLFSADYNLVGTTDSLGRIRRYEYNELNAFESLIGVPMLSEPYEVVKSVTYPDAARAKFAYDRVGNSRTVTDLSGNPTKYTLSFYGNPLTMAEPLGKTSQMTWSITEGKSDNVMTSKTDSLGRKTTWEHDKNGNITKETDPYGHTVTSLWNKFSQPLTRTDRNGVSQSWVYDEAGNLTDHTDGDGKKFSSTYNGVGERQTLTTPSGTTRYSWDVHGNPDTVTGPEGSVVDRDCDVRGRLAAETDAEGHTTIHSYDTLDYRRGTTYPENPHAYGAVRVISRTYDPVGNLLTENDRNGLGLTYAYTLRDQVKTIARSIGGGKTFAYDPSGNLLSETDWKGAATTHGYNALNQRTATVNRLGNAMGMIYDTEGNLLSTADYEGNRTTHAYDRLNRTTETTVHGEGGGTTLFTYYNEGGPDTNLKTVTDAEGNTTGYEYNGRYLKTRQIDALGGEHLWAFDDAGNLATETDEEGNYTSFEYDGQNRMIASVRMGGSRTAFAFDKNGNRTQVTDAAGNVTRTEYDSWGRVIKVTDPEGYSVVTRHDGMGNPVSVTDANGVTRTMVRDRRGLPLTETDGEGHTVTRTYDQNGNVRTATDRRGTVVTSTYDAEDRLLETVESGMGLTRSQSVVSRDKMGNPTRVTDYNGNAVITEYNALYLPVAVTDALDNTTRTTYNKNGRVLTVTDRRGNTVTTEYDALGRTVRVTDPLGQALSTTYDGVGNALTVTDKRGIVTKNSYDDLYRLQKSERAGIPLVTNEYDDLDNLAASTDAEGNRIAYAYDKRNLPVKTTFADGTFRTKTYDGVGNALTETDEEGRATAFTFDRENRVKSITFAGESTQKSYDASGNLVSETRPEGNGRAMAYDGFARLASVTEGGLKTRYDNDAMGNLTHIFDPAGNQVAYEYDALNRKTHHIQYKSSGSLTTRIRYDEEGNLTSMTDPAGRTFTYTYDALNRRTDARYPDLSGPYLETVQIETRFDANGNVTGITEHKTRGVTDETANAYDDWDRLSSSSQRGVFVRYTYDDNGNRTSVTTESGTIAYAYDVRNRILTATVGSDVTTYAYFKDGKKRSVVYPNGTGMAYTYHDTNRVKSITNKVTATGTVISSYGYGYDHNGNRTSQVELQNGISETFLYTYDGLDRMNGFTVTSDTQSQATAYTFNAYNRKTETVTTDGIVTKSRTLYYDETNWLTHMDDDTDDAAPFTITYAYDKNGNTVQKLNSSLTDQETRFTYDSRNQMVQATRGPPAAETVLGQYDYNAAGLRVRHLNSSRGNVEYFYDGPAVIEERNSSDKTLLAHYRYADRLLSLDTGSEVQYYHHDALGSTVNLTTDDGSVKVSYWIDPFGAIRKQEGSSVNRQIFTGQEHDEKTGLVYFGARYYDPDTARFITQDSYLGESGTPPSLHRYLYAYSNPTVYVDLYGNSAVDTFFGVADSATNHAVNLAAATGRYFSGRSNWYSKEDVKASGGSVVRSEASSNTPLSKVSWYEKQFSADWRNLEFKTVYAENSVEENVKNVLGIRPIGKAIGNFAGAASQSFDVDSNIRKQAHYDLGSNGLTLGLVAAPVAKGALARRGAGAATTTALTVYDAEFATWQSARTGALSEGAAALTVESVVGEELNTKLLHSQKNADFYVTPSGDAVPGTFHRYAHSKYAPMADAKSGVLPAKRGGSYLSFDAIDDAIIASDQLQIPYRPDYRVSGNSLDIIDNVNIPKGDWGRANHLEPLTADFKKFGPGKATQVIVDGPIPVDPNSIKKLQ